MGSLYIVATVETNIKAAFNALSLAGLIIIKYITAQNFSFIRWKEMYESAKIWTLIMSTSESGVNDPFCERNRFFFPDFLFTTLYNLILDDINWGLCCLLLV